MQKGQLSFDFLLSIVMFLVVIGFVFIIVNDMEDKNLKIIENVNTYGLYLSIHDAVQSSRYFDDFEFKNIAGRSIDGCTVETNSTTKTIQINSQDNVFIINNYVGEAVSQDCGNSIKFR